MVSLLVQCRFKPCAPKYVSFENVSYLTGGEMRTFKMKFDLNQCSHRDLTIHLFYTFNKVFQPMEKMVELKIFISFHCQPGRTETFGKPISFCSGIQFQRNYRKNQGKPFVKISIHLSYDPPNAFHRPLFIKVVS